MTEYEEGFVVHEVVMVASGLECLDKLFVMCLLFELMSKFEEG